MENNEDTEYASEFIQNSWGCLIASVVILLAIMATILAISLVNK